MGQVLLRMNLQYPESVLYIFYHTSGALIKMEIKFLICSQKILPNIH